MDYLRSGTFQVSYYYSFFFLSSCKILITWIHLNDKHIVILTGLVIRSVLNVYCSFHSISWGKDIFVWTTCLPLKHNLGVWSLWGKNTNLTHKQRRPSWCFCIITLHLKNYCIRVANRGRAQQSCMLPVHVGYNQIQRFHIWAVLLIPNIYWRQNLMAPAFFSIDLKISRCKIPQALIRLKDELQCQTIT